jgi:hypothetical protein
MIKEGKEQSSSREMISELKSSWKSGIDGRTAKVGWKAERGGSK